MERYTPVNPDRKSSEETLLYGRDEPGSEEDDETFTKFKHSYQDVSWFKRHKRSIAFNSLLFLLNLTICAFFLAWVSSRYEHYPLFADTPARDIIRYEPKQLDLLPVYLPDGTLNPDKPGHFNGKPTPELAEDWKSIMQHQNARLSKEELGPFSNDENVIQLADGSGYFGTLAVFHGLHCLKRLHHYVHKDSYYPNQTELDAARLLYHTEHCIDWLRQYVQCNADTTLIPFYWGATQKHPLAMDKGKHQCVSWDPLEKWMAEHSFNAFEKGLLMHPIFGDPYTGEKADTIGIALGDHAIDGGHH